MRSPITQALQHCISWQQISLLHPPPQDLPSRPRRNRRSETFRTSIRENFLSPAHFILPIFVHEGAANEPIASMPGINRLAYGRSVLDHVAEARSLGVNQVVIFPKVRRSAPRRVPPSHFPCAASSCHAHEAQRDGHACETQESGVRGDGGEQLCAGMRTTRCTCRTLIQLCCSRLVRLCCHGRRTSLLHPVDQQTPEHLKTSTAEEAFNPNGLSQRTIRLLKDAYPDLEVRGCAPRLVVFKL